LNINYNILFLSGLVIGKFCRLENECKTVLDLWETTCIPRSNEENRSPLENAVIKGDLKQVESLIKSGLAYVNEQDANGWTALHLSSSFCFNLHRLDICEYFLTLEETDASMVNNYGNTPVHYLSRMPIGDAQRALYRDVLLAMLQNDIAIHKQNAKVCFLLSLLHWLFFPELILFLFLLI
jgi:ankyrin repeat protein